MTFPGSKILDKLNNCIMGKNDIRNSGCVRIVLIFRLGFTLSTFISHVGMTSRKTLYANSAVLKLSNLLRIKNQQRVKRRAGKKYSLYSIRNNSTYYRIVCMGQSKVHIAGSRNSIRSRSLLYLYFFGLLCLYRSRPPLSHSFTLIPQIWRLIYESQRKNDEIFRKFLFYRPYKNV